MPYGLYLSAAGADVQSRRLEVLANNLANVDTPGFKRQLAVAQARYAEATERGMDQFGSRSINDLGGGVKVRQTKTDFSAGTLQRTGGDTDVAIDGEGFFIVDRRGEQYLTRAGNFMFDNTGTLMTQDGYKVLDGARAPIVVNPADGPVSIAPDGRVFQKQGNANVPIQDIAIARPGTLEELVHAGENLFTATGSVSIVAPEERNVRSGYLEKSGVKPTNEMMELIEASRAFEANVNMIRGQDQVIGALLGRVLRA